MAGPAAGELRYVAHKGTLSGLRCQFLSPGPGGEGRGGGPAWAPPSARPGDPGPAPYSLRVALSSVVSRVHTPLLQERSVRRPVQPLHLR